MSDTSYDYDFVVIGGGSGGVRAARIAAGHGAKVALIEKQAMGGTCVNLGCVPKKLMVYAAHYAEDIKDAKGYGWSIGETSHDWSKLIDVKNKEIERLNGIYDGLLERAGVTIIKGFGSFVDAHTLDVDGQKITSKNILIATGGKPNTPDHEGAEYGITSDNFFYLKEQPKEALIVGAGYIALEFACILNSLGSDVTILYRGDKILRGFDEDVRDAMQLELEKQGLNIRLNASMIGKMVKTNKGCDVTLQDGEDLGHFDQVIYGIGRHPNTQGLNLDAAGVTTNAKGAIETNDDFQTAQAHIYAVGDVTSRVDLTPVALNEGHILADRLFNTTTRVMDYTNIPTAVFTNPPLATCGLTEAEALTQYDNLDIYTSTFSAMKFRLAGRDEKTFMKLIVDQATDKVIGAHMMGQDTPEMMQAVGIALKAGLTKADFDATIGIHPTAAEEFVTMRSITRQASRNV